jgi:dienelactone hydrolase
MRTGLLVAVLILLGFAAARADPAILSRDNVLVAPQGAETGPDRRQAWTVLAPAPLRIARAILYRPPGDGPFPLALIAHASTQNALRRAQLPAPDYPGLASALVARGYAVVVPERPGHGATGGSYLEDQRGCDDADYFRAGTATAQAIRAAWDSLQSQSFIRRDGGVLLGHSAGGLGVLALAAEPPRGVTRLVVFAPGRGGGAGDRSGAVCAEDRLVAALAQFGRGRRLPVAWIVARNDTTFPPALSQRMAEAFAPGGQGLTLLLRPALPAGDGHALAETGDSAALAAVLDAALPRMRRTAP